MTTCIGLATFGRKSSGTSSGTDAPPTGACLSMMRFKPRYADWVGERHARDLFSVIKKIHTSSSMNVEALRKLVKKFDKVCLRGVSGAA